MKSSIKAAAYDFLVRVLFKCGFNWRAGLLICSESVKPVKAVRNM